MLIDDPFHTFLSGLSLVAVLHLGPYEVCCDPFSGFLDPRSLSTKLSTSKLAPAFRDQSLKGRVVNVNITKRYRHRILVKISKIVTDNDIKSFDKENLETNQLDLWSIRSKNVYTSFCSRKRCHDQHTGNYI